MLLKVFLTAVSTVGAHWLANDEGVLGVVRISGALVVVVNILEITFGMVGKVWNVVVAGVVDVVVGNWVVVVATKSKENQ